MIHLSDIRTIYFIGIGGIGMSAIARYFKSRGVVVHGYDRTETILTKQLVAEGMSIHYTDNPKLIPGKVDLVVYTPAVPKDHKELAYFNAHHFPVKKRSEVLGIISKGMKTMGVAGTHGKTTTSSILNHILRTGGLDNTSFLGGIAYNYMSNYIEGKGKWVVVEADEYDRSFLQLYPDIAIILSMDPDHLDIYGDEAHMLESYHMYASQVKEGGLLLHRTGLPIEIPEEWYDRMTIKTFGLGGGDFHAENIRVEDGWFVFDFISKNKKILNLKLGLPGQHNVENATAATAAALHVGVGEDAIKEALESFKGVKRRFEVIYRNEKVVYIDDYAHHPTELESAILAARTLFPERKIMGIFQPHLFSRTNDFAAGFATALDKLDEVLLLDIYPARELPMEGVTSSIIFEKMKLANKKLLTKNELMDVLTSKKIDVLMTLGAGDIDTFTEPIKNWLSNS